MDLGGLNHLSYRLRLTPGNSKSWALHRRTARPSLPPPSSSKQLVPDLLETRALRKSGLSSGRGGGENSRIFLYQNHRRKFDVTFTPHPVPKWAKMSSASSRKGVEKRVGADAGFLLFWNRQGVAEILIRLFWERFR